MSVFQALIGEHGAIADLVLLDLLNGFIGLGHGEGLGLRLDAVACGNVEHFADHGWAAGGAAADGAQAGDEREGVHGDRCRGNADKAEGSGGAQGLDVDAPVLIGIDGA